MEAHTIFVVDGIANNLLGLPAITSLNLAVRVDATTDLNADVTENFPSVFKGLGNMGEEFEIKPRPDAKPRCLYAPRHVPLPMFPRITEELNNMESMGVITKVDEATPWCAGMVVVPKKGQEG